MSIGWTIVFIIMLITLGSILYSGVHSIVGGIFLFIFFPFVAGMGIFTIYSGYKAFTGGPPSYGQPVYGYSPMSSPPTPMGR